MMLVCILVHAQRFFNLTAEEVRIDSVLPVFTHTIPLGSHYADSTYTVSIAYPEFIPMSATDIERCQRIFPETPPAMPTIHQSIGVVRKQGLLQLAFTPIVYRNGQFQKLVSFMLKVEATANPATRRASNAQARYAENSVLRSGTWAKIRVPSSGIYQLTSDLIRQAGFTDLNKVKIYGYGGALQPEILSGDYLSATDDLKEVATCTVGGRRLFYAIGPVTWNSNKQRVRNPYSDYGYYFLTENDSTALAIDSATFVNGFYPSGEYYATLFEVDNYAWYQGGRNLYNSDEIKAGTTRSYTMDAATTGRGTLNIVLSAVSGARISVSLNDSVIGTVNIDKQAELEAMRTGSLSRGVRNLQATNTVTITNSESSGSARLDYISIYANEPKAAPNLSTATFPSPEYVYHITNQNHHADKAADMVIIIPTTQKLLKQAQRLKALHEEKDTLRVNIVPADELFNEFSSGTPDANAYRRYLKMLYDRAETESDMPRYLLLLGDGAWDNRMNCSEWSSSSPDDYLLCYESENSYSHTKCYTSDDFFCMLDDGEGGNLVSSDKSDVAVGRISALSADEATIVVDKIENYINQKEAGIWQNTVCYMGDDGNQNKHMQDADSIATQNELLRPDMLVKRIMWDAYTRVSSSTGKSYPDVTRLIKQQMQQGALIMNYSGHGRADAVSHEYVLRLADFAAATSMRLPLWLTASCDIMPFDGREENIGETALFNSKGGAIAFYGTTRTVYQPQNKLMNLAFMHNVLSTDEQGRPMPIGEAVRQAKNELVTTGVFLGYDSRGREIWSTDLSENKLQYTLLGDPAMRLALPTSTIVIDSINNTSMTAGATLTLKAGSTATIRGHVLNSEGTVNSTFNGVVSAVVRDAREEIVCKLNDPTEADEAFTFYDRPNTIFSGNDSVRQGRFTFTFVVPKDIAYSSNAALINLYAVNNQKTITASGHCDQLVMNGTENTASDNLGPSIYCYLNSSSFTNGGNVNSTPYFVAELSDEDGINATGSGIGHDLELIIDGDMSKTYSLNDYFQYDFGTYTRGRIGYSIPTLEYGQHRLLFRAWDVMNNSSTAELTFNVVKGQEPLFLDLSCSPNPASSKTTFYIVHDRINSAMDVVLDVFDISGRHLWTYSENSVASAGNTFSFDWDLTVDGGRRLQTGVYLYRLRISSEGSTYASKAKKLIILTNK